MNAETRQPSFLHAQLRACLVLIALLLAVGTVAAQKNFYNEEFKAGFKYPATWKLTTRDMGLPEEGFKGLAEVWIPRTGKNVSAFAFVSAAKTTPDKCKLFMGDDNEKPKRVTMGTITFDKTEEVEGGMESVTPLEHYQTFHEGVCYDIDLGLPQAKYGRKGISDERLLNQLYVVLRTLYFGH